MQACSYKTNYTGTSEVQFGCPCLQIFLQTAIACPDVRLAVVERPTLPVLAAIQFVNFLDQLWFQQYFVKYKYLASRFLLGCKKENVFPSFMKFKFGHNSKAAMKALYKLKRIWLIEELKTWHTKLYYT